MNTPTRILTQCIAAIGIIGLVTPALATPMTELEKDQTKLKETVSYRDLNIANPEGAKLLYARIEHAADYVCGYDLQSYGTGMDTNFQNCKIRAIAQAVGRIDKPELTAVMERYVPSQEVANAKLSAARERTHRG